MSRTWRGSNACFETTMTHLEKVPLFGKPVFDSQVEGLNLVLLCFGRILWFKSRRALKSAQVVYLPRMVQKPLPVYPNLCTNPNPSCYFYGKKDNQTHQVFNTTDRSSVINLIVPRSVVTINCGCLIPSHARYTPQTPRHRSLTLNHTSALSNLSIGLITNS